VPASYDHYNWKEDAAITKNHYGKGTAIYKGTNVLGKTVRYFLNYSESPQKIEYFYKNGRELLTGKAVKPGDSIEIPAWDLKITEEE